MGEEVHDTRRGEMVTVMHSGGGGDQKLDVVDTNNNSTNSEAETNKNHYSQMDDISHLTNQPQSEDLNKSFGDIYRDHPELLNEPSFKSKFLSNITKEKFNNDNNLMKVRKSNSTTSLFIQSTIDNPNVSEIVYCLGKAIFLNIKNSESKGKPNVGPIPNVFNEENFPLNDDLDLENSPSIEKIQFFLSLLFNGENLSPECGVMALGYIDRLLSLVSNLHLHACNWRRITLGAVILASKVWEDQAVWNADFLSVFPNAQITDLNRLERQFLNAIKFMVTLKSSVYTKYYFDLIDLSDRREYRSQIKQLTEEELRRLESKSKGIEDQYMSQSTSRSRSFDMSTKVEYDD